MDSDIHNWITTSDFNNANLMILLGYVIIGHPEWRKAQIKIFTLVPEGDLKNQKQELLGLIKAGHLSISVHNVKLIEKSDDFSVKEVINDHSIDADLTIVGCRSEALKQLRARNFAGNEQIRNVLFVNSTAQKEIK